MVNKPDKPAERKEKEMNAKLSAMGIIWASERPKSRSSRSVSSDVLLCVAIHSPRKTPQLVLSFHQRLMAQAKLQIEDKIDVGIDTATATLYIKKSHNGHKICNAGGNKKSKRGIARFCINDQWLLVKGKYSMSDCSEIESADGLIAAKLPDTIFANKRGAE